MLKQHSTALYFFAESIKICCNNHRPDRNYIASGTLRFNISILIAINMDDDSDIFSSCALPIFRHII